MHLVEEELPRNEIMYGEGGYAYVYLCYGIHHLFNVVTNSRDVPHAILIRALDPIEGIEEMLLRTNKKKLDHTLTRGPGNVSKALGIFTKHSGFHCWEIRSLLPMTEENIAKRKLQPRHALGSIMRERMPYYHIVFM